METDIEVKMLLNEISKLNDKLDSIEELLIKQKCTLNNMYAENAKTISLSNESKKQTSNSFPSDKWLDKEEMKELAEAKKNASAEWHSICYLQNKLNEAMDEIFKLKHYKSVSELLNQNDTIKEKNNGHTEIL